MNHGRWVGLRLLVVFAAMLAAGEPCRGQVRPRDPDVKLVLVLQSHGPTVAHGMAQADGVRAVAEDRFGRKVALYEEYLQMSARDDESTRVAWRDFLRKRYEGARLDAIVLIDSRAMDFWLTHGELISAGTPVVFSGLVEIPEGLAAAPFVATGVMERLDVCGTLELMKRAMPERDRLVVVTTASEHGVLHRRLVDEAVKRVGGIRAVHLQAPLDSELERATETDAAHTACLYVSGWAQDASGAVRHPVRVVNRRDQVPVLVQYEYAVRMGALGGSVILARQMGERAGEMLARVLEGEDPRTIPVEMSTPSELMLDWNQMDRWRVERSALNSDSIVIKPPATWIERNARALTIAGIVLVAVNLAVPWAIVVIVSRNNRLRRRAEVALRDSRDSIESLLAAASRLQGVGDEQGVLQEMVQAIHATGWSMVLAGLYSPEWKRTRVAHAGLTPENVEKVEAHPPAPAQLRALFAPERDRFRVSRSYFVACEWAEQLDIARVASRCGSDADDGLHWMNKDLAYIPLVNSQGRIMGAISIDGPSSGLRPTEATFRYLEFFADLAARRIEHLRLDTEQRAAEEARRASESYLASIAESLPGMVYRAIVSADGMVRYAYQSGRAAEIYGRMPDDAKPLERIGEFCPDDDGERVREQVRRSLATLEPMDIQYRVLSVDGAERWVHGLAKARRMENGDTVFDGIVLDITRQKQAEQALQESRERLEAITRNLPGVVFRNVVTRDLEVQLQYDSQWDNPKTPGSAADRKPFEQLGSSLCAEERMRLQAATLRSVQSLEPLDLQLRVGERGGDERWMHMIATVTRLPNGDTAFDGIALDVTDEKRSERALLESEKRYYTLYDSNPLPVIVFAADTLAVLDVNAAAEEQYGYTREEFTQLTIMDILPPGSFEGTGNAHCSVAARAIGGSPRHCRRDGSLFDVSVRSHEVRLGEMDVCVSITQDVTEVRRAEAARRESEAHLRRFAETQRMLLQELDHRVKNAMAGLLAMIDLCAPSYRSIDEFATAVRRRIRAMADVHSMLSESRWMPVDLRRLALSLAPPDAEGKVELVGPSVCVPPRQATALGMIFQELMSNATKYGALRQQGGLVQIEWRVVGVGAEGGSIVQLVWRERCPTAVVLEGKPGLGTSLVRGFAQSELRGSVAMRFMPHGVEHELSMTLDESDDAEEAPKLAA